METTGIIGKWTKRALCGIANCCFYEEVKTAISHQAEALRHRLIDCGKTILHCSSFILAHGILLLGLVIVIRMIKITKLAIIFIVTILGTMIM